MRWQTLPAALRVAIVVVGLVVAVNVTIAALDSATRGAETEGRDSDPGSTAPNGTSAWAELLERNGAEVSTSQIGKGDFERGAVLVMLGIEELSSVEAARVRDVLSAGGRLLVGPESIAWLQLVVDTPPTWSPGGAEIAQAVGDAQEVVGIGEVRSDGRGGWSALGSSRALLEGDGLEGNEVVIASVATVGRGSVVLLADPSIVANEHLDEADNAAFALQVTGDGRTIQLFEPETERSEGLAAVPDRWKLALVGLVLAFLVGAVARGRRVGPPDPPGTPRPPPRRSFVDAMGAALERTRRPGGALEPLRTHVRAELARRAGLAADASDEELRSAARRLGWPDDEIEAVVRPTTPDTVLASGRALSRLAQREE